VPQALSRLSCADQVRAGFLDQPVCASPRNSTHSGVAAASYVSRVQVMVIRSGGARTKVRNHLAGSHHADWESSGACGIKCPPGVFDIGPRPILLLKQISLELDS